MRSRTVGPRQEAGSRLPWGWRVPHWWRIRHRPVRPGIRPRRGGKMGVAAHREAPLRALIRKQADFRLSYGSTPGGSIHWLRDRSTARRAYSERLAPGLLAAQRDGAYPVE